MLSRLMAKSSRSERADSACFRSVTIEPRAANHETRGAPQCCRPQSFLLFKRRQGESTDRPFHTIGTDANNLLSISQKDEVFLNLVLEYVPETVYRASRHYAKLKQVMPMLQVKLYMYQVSLRAISSRSKPLLNLAYDPLVNSSFDR